MRSTVPEAADEEQHDTDADVGEQDTHPDLVGERVHEREHISLLQLRLLDHDTYAETHERLGEVHNALTLGRDSEGRDG